MYFKHTQNLMLAYAKFNLQMYSGPSALSSSNMKSRNQRIMLLNIIAYVGVGASDFLFNPPQTNCKLGGAGVPYTV